MTSFLLGRSCGAASSVLHNEHTRAAAAAQKVVGVKLHNVLIATKKGARPQNTLTKYVPENFTALGTFILISKRGVTSSSSHTTIMTKICSTTNTNYLAIRFSNLR